MNKRVQIVDPGGFYDGMEGVVVRREEHGLGNQRHAYPVVRFDEGDEQVFPDEWLEEIDGC